MTLAVEPKIIGQTRAVVVAAVAIVGLNIADVLTTKIALNRGASEGNPIAGLFVTNLPLFVAIKVLLPAVVALRLWSIRRRVTPMLLAGMWFVVGCYTVALYVNLTHLVAS